MSTQNGNLKRLFILALGITLWTKAATADGTSGEMLPRSWYLKIDVQATQSINAYIDEQNLPKLNLPAGLYVQDHREVFERPDLKADQLIDPTRLSLPEHPKSTLGFASHRPTAPKELWIVLPNNQRYRLASLAPAAGPAFKARWEVNLFLHPVEEERYWKPVFGGALWFSSRWHPFLQFNDPADRKKLQGPGTQAQGIPLLFTGEANKRIQPRVVTRAIRKGAKPTPLYHYQSSEDKALFVVCPLGALTLSPIPSQIDKSCDQYDLVLYDLKSRTGLRLAQELKWPISFSNRGVYYQDDKNQIHFFELDWKRGQLKPKSTTVVYKLLPQERMVSYGTHFVIKRGVGRQLDYVLADDYSLKRFRPETKRFEKVQEEEDADLIAFFEEDEQGFKTFNADILPDLKSGARVPLYSIKEVSRLLSSRLGATKNSWATLVYRPGQLPEELVADFFWKINTGAIEAKTELKELDRVYHLPGHLFDVQDSEELQARLQDAKALIEKKRALLYLSDYPVAKGFEADLQGAMDRVTLFHKHFNKCIQAGDCRVIISMREDVYLKVVKALENYFEDSQLIFIPQLEPANLNEIVSGARLSLQRRRNRFFTEEGLEVFNSFLSKNQPGLEDGSPGREFTALQQLFDYLGAYHSQGSEINRSIVRSWIENRSGVDLFRQRLDAAGTCKRLQEETVSSDHVTDAICSALYVIQEGKRIHKKGPLAKFILLGPTGTGKTYIAEVLGETLPGAKYHEVDMSEFQGITKNSPLYQTLKSNPNQIKIINFDDVDQVQGNRDAIEKLAAVMDSGIYGSGTEVELDFRNAIVFWTANWAEGLLSDPNVNVHSVIKDIGLFLTQKRGNSPAIIRQRIWGRIEKDIYAMPAFTEPELLELALKIGRGQAKYIYEENQVEVKVDPELLMEIAAAEKEAKAGARSIKNRIEADLFGKPFTRRLVDSRTESILILQDEDANEPCTIMTNTDPNFSVAWKDPSFIKIRSFKRSQIKALVCRYVAEHGSSQNLSDDQIEKYIQTHCTPRRNK